MDSWLPIPRGSPFSLANIPFGIITHDNDNDNDSDPTPRPAVAIGDHALDLCLFAAGSGFRNLAIVQPHQAVFAQPTLNAFAALGRPMHAVVRKYLQTLLLRDTPWPELLRDSDELRQRCLVPLAAVTNHLPMAIGDYSDFFAGRHHAFNCGVIFRGAANALQPNYCHLPVGYHGRASSVVVSGTPVRRPRGQVLTQPQQQPQQPSFAPTRRLDIELELAAFVCKPSTLGDPVPVDDADAHLFGLVLMNDWSARDIQAWEYVPLGPFNAKNFATSISPWVVLMDALEPFRAAALSNDVAELPYLAERQSKRVFDIELEVELTTPAGRSHVLSSTNARNLLFSFPQMLAHHSVTGCPFRVGDLLGSGTISGATLDADDSSDPAQRQQQRQRLGSLLEMTAGGREPIKLGANGDESEQRLFLEDGDRVTLRGIAGGSSGYGGVGFGEVTGVILPAHTN